jgi:hypothetical protein
MLLLVSGFVTMVAVCHCTRLMSSGICSVSQVQQGLHFFDQTFIQLRAVLHTYGAQTSPIPADWNDNQFTIVLMKQRRQYAVNLRQLCVDNPVPLQTFQHSVRHVLY